MPFLADPTTNPIDTHELVAMVAPRGLFIMDNPFIGELSRQYGYLAPVAGAEVYKALGAQYNIGYDSAISNGTHCAMRPEWSAPLKNSIEKFLTRTGHLAESIDANAVQQEVLADWRTWTTPTLNWERRRTTVQASAARLRRAKRGGAGGRERQRAVPRLVELTHR